MSNVFKAPGSSRANKQQHNNMAVANAAMPLYNSYSSFLNGYQPLINQGYGNLLAMGMHPNTQAIVDQMRQHVYLNSLLANHAAMNMYGNGALAQASGINAMNKAMDTSNAFMGQQYDPTTVMNHMASALGYMQTPLQNMSTLASTVYGAPQITPGKGALDYALDIGNTAAGLGWRPLA
jgi:hypothetical protein